MGALPFRDATWPVNVRWFGEPTGVDDAALFDAAYALAGNGGAVYVPPLDWILGDYQLPVTRVRTFGAGLNSRIITKAGAAYAIEMVSKQFCLFDNLTINGGGKGVGGGILVRGDNALGTSQHNCFTRLKFIDCNVGCHVVGTGAAPTADQVDKNTWWFCEWENNSTGLWLDSTNAQIQWIDAFAFNSNDIHVRASHCTLAMAHGGFQYNLPNQIGILCDGVNMDSVNLRDIWFEAAPGSGCLAIDALSGAVEGWPTVGVIAEHVTFAFTPIQMARIGGAGTVPVFDAKHCRFHASNINTTIADSVFNDEYNSFENGSIWNPTGAAAVSSHRYQRAYDGYRQWQGANLVMSMLANGNPSFFNLGDYANNAAALAAGLVAGDVYRTGGAVMIVV